MTLRARHAHCDIRLSRGESGYVRAEDDTCGTVLHVMHKRDDVEGARTWAAAMRLTVRDCDCGCLS